MSTLEKQKAVEKIEQIYKSSSSVILAHYHGLTVTDLNQLRSKLRDDGGAFTVVKNTLAKIAAKNVDFKCDHDLFTGPVAIAYSDDPIAAAKGVVKFAEANDNLKIVGGVVDGAILSVEEIKQLSKMPSLDELRGKLVALLQTPATNIARVLQAPASQVVRVIKAYSDKN